MERNTCTSLVCGGAGFVGSHLCEFLLRAGNKVICMDDLSTGRMDNVRLFLGTPMFKFVEHDVSAPFPTDMTDWGITEIYNLACAASPRDYQQNPIATLRTSFVGSMNLLDLARKTDARILLASTSEVYGDPLVTPQDEDYWGNVNPNGIRSCYDEGKRVAETLFCDYHRQYGTDTRIVRIFNTYGPRMREGDGRVVPNFIVQALRGDSLTVYGDGKQTRSFLYIDDLVAGISGVMKSSAVATPVNIGNPNETSIAELAQLVKTLTHSASEIAYYPLPRDDPKRRKPNIARAKMLLDGWEPHWPLSEGLRKTIAYFSKTNK